MPRKRQETYSGQPAQRIRSVPGQRYGEGQETSQLQHAMPAPDNRLATQQAAGAVGAPAPPLGTGPQLEEIAAMMARNGRLSAGGWDGPTDRPDEPTTTGLPIGIGPGPEVLASNPAISPYGAWLRQLSAAVGDPKYAEMATRAGL